MLNLMQRFITFVEPTLLVSITLNYFIGFYHAEPTLLVFITLNYFIGFYHAEPTLLVSTLDCLLPHAEPTIFGLYHFEPT